MIDAIATLLVCLLVFNLCLVLALEDAIDTGQAEHEQRIQALARLPE